MMSNVNVSKKLNLAVHLVLFTAIKNVVAFVRKLINALIEKFGMKQFVSAFVPGLDAMLDIIMRTCAIALIECRFL